MEAKINSPIFITGVERSGSSIVARIVAMCGVHTGEVTEMQENKQLKELMSSLYVKNELDPRGQFPIPLSGENDLYHYNWKAMTLSCIAKPGCATIQNLTWMYKSSRIAQIWPIWHNAFPDAKWIIVRRRTGDIIQSCIKTGFMTAYANKAVLQQINAKDEAEGWLWWVHEQEKHFSDMIEAGVQYKEIWPERMAIGDYEQIKELITWLDLEWNEKVVDIVQPLLKNSKQKA